MTGHINFDDIGMPFARVDKKIIHLSPKPVDDGFDTYKTKNGQVVQLIPDKSRERDVIYVFGASGSGKSYYIKQYLMEYHKMFPKRDVFMFSSLASDPAFDSLKYIKRMKIKEDLFMNTELTTEDFKDSLCIFDDCDVISQVKIRRKIMSLLNNMLETGRHTKTSVVYVSHLASNGLESRRILNESHAFVCFPANINGKNAKYFFENYLSLDKIQIKRLKDMDSRAVCFIKSYPQLVVWDSGVSILKSF